MRTSRVASFLLVPCLALAVLSTASPAMAADPEPAAAETPVIETAPPAEPEEGDLVEVEDTESEEPAPTEPAPPGQPVPFGQACLDGYRYEPTSKGKSYHKGVGVEQANYNGTSRTARSTFTSEAEGEVGIAVSGKLKMKASTVIAEVEKEFGIELSLKLRTKIGNMIRVDTPSKKTTYARYGVYRLKTKGYSQYVYINCTKGVKHNSTMYTPRRVGWAIWEK